MNLPDSFPSELILAVASVETGEYAHWNNEHVADDWGRGIMQITSNTYVGAGGVNSGSNVCIKCKNRDAKIYCSKYYTNNLTGIEANIKDGLYALKDKYDAVQNNILDLITLKYYDAVSHIKTSIDLNRYDLIKIKTIWAYNGFGIDKTTGLYTGHYLHSVSSALKNLVNDFTEVLYANEDNLIEKLEAADQNKEVIRPHSPIILQVINSYGKVTGLFDGEIKEDLELSLYDSSNGAITIFSPEDSLHYKIIGVEDGMYGISIISDKSGERTTFEALDIPITVDEVHVYTINWEALSHDEEGVIIQVDSNGDGSFEHTFAADIDLTHYEFLHKIDNLPPMTMISLSGPQYGSYISSTTQFTLTAEDNPGGSGVDKTYYSIDTLTDPGTEYVGPFSLSLPDGPHVIYYHSTDKAGNIEPVNIRTVILDNAEPSVVVLNPPIGSSLHGGTTFIASVTDSGSGVASLAFSVRKADGAEGTPIGFEDLQPTYDPTTGQWSLPFDTTSLLDGDYILLAEASDELGNAGSSVTIYAIRNLAVALDIMPTAASVEPGSSAQYVMSVQNIGGVSDTYDLMLQGLDPSWFSFSQDVVTVDPGQTATVTLTVSPPKQGIPLEDYDFIITATSRTSAIVSDSQDATLEITFAPTLPALPGGGLAVAIKPKTTTTLAGTEIEVSITVVNNENFDDVLWLNVTSSGIAAQYQLDAASFSWTSLKVYVPSKDSFTASLEVSVPQGKAAGNRMFKVVTRSTTWPKGYAQDYGIIQVKT